MWKIHGLSAQIPFMLTLDTLFYKIYPLTTVSTTTMPKRHLQISKIKKTVSICFETVTSFLHLIENIIL